MRRAVLLVVVLLALAGCGSSDASKTADLRQWLTDTHGYDHNYDDLGTATYKDGNVTVKASRVWADQHYGAYFLCAWVEPWLRDLGNGSKSSQIIVVMGGREVLRSHAASESCQLASYNSG